MLHRYNAVDALCRAGIDHADAIALRHISMTLHRWHELECGNGNDHASWCIVRGYKKAGEFTYDDEGKPYTETHYHNENKARYYPVRDQERGALKRLATIMAKYPRFDSYIQGDPRGASLYILDKATTPQPYDQFYSRGIVVCQ